MFHYFILKSEDELLFFIKSYKINYSFVGWKYIVQIKWSSLLIWLNPYFCLSYLNAAVNDAWHVTDFIAENADRPPQIYVTGRKTGILTNEIRIWKVFLYQIRVYFFLNIAFYRMFYNKFTAYFLNCLLQILKHIFPSPQILSHSSLFFFLEHLIQNLFFCFFDFLPLGFAAGFPTVWPLAILALNWAGASLAWQSSLFSLSEENLL